MGLAMAPKPATVLCRLRAALEGAYGSRIERTVLFGSRARAEGGPTSDYDVALFLYPPAVRASDLRTVAEIETDLLFDTGAVINTLVLPAGSHADRTGFMAEVRRDGVDL